MRLLVCGGRDYENGEAVNSALEVVQPTVVITGGARGADLLAKNWAMIKGVPYIEMPAQWRAYGTGAGAVRNYNMIIHLLPDAVMHFPGGPGTAHMVKIATKEGIGIIDGEQV